DTWFSSALWPFSTLGWPNTDSEDLKYFFPTNTLVTGYDIIFFWVARMIFSSVEQMGTYPFDTIFIHGIVRDELGRKMSKSLGNGIDPLVVIDKYGADALRFTLVTGNSPGNDMRYSEKKVEASRNFGNKIWNAARYILMNLDGSEGPAKLPAAEDLAIEDKWILSKFNTLCKEVSENIDSYELGVALAKLYDFIWDLFCDWYIEISKIRLQEGGKGAETAKAVLIYCMDGMLKLLHPFMPFLTEEIWQSLPHEGDTIMLAPYPEYTDALDFSAEETEFERIMTAVRAIRARRSEMNVPPSKKSAVHFDTPFEETFRSGIVYIQRLASATEVTVGGDFDTEGAVNIVTADAQIYLPMNELVDLDAEKERLTKELEKAQKDLAFFEKKLNNPGFVNNAPAAVVEKDRASAEKIKDKINLLEESLKNLA
ncbi:MAG: class I tRNA ligase family protein, partial [Clostridia bacterium]|nr:class I tRNA ligase family protein [Clostridia bacterium]